MSSRGEVVSLWRYPVKSLQGETVRRTALGAHGLAGDRSWAVRDAASGAVLTAKREPRLLLAAAALRGETVAVTLPDGREVTGAAAETGLSDLLGRPVRLTAAAAPAAAHVDVAPLHLLAAASCEAWDVRRFRANVILGGDVDLETLVGERVQVGGLVLDIVARTRRCSMVSAAQPGLDKDVGVLRALARHSDLCHGVYARVALPGVISVGDTVRR